MSEALQPRIAVALQHEGGVHERRHSEFVGCAQLFHSVGKYMGKKDVEEYHCRSRICGELSYQTHDHCRSRTREWDERTVCERKHGMT